MVQAAHNALYRPVKGGKGDRGTVFFEGALGNTRAYADQCLLSRCDSSGTVRIGASATTLRDQVIASIRARNRFTGLETSIGHKQQTVDRSTHVSTTSDNTG